MDSHTFHMGATLIIYDRIFAEAHVEFSVHGCREVQRSDR